MFTFHNMMNRVKLKTKQSLSNYKGVDFYAKSSKWRARITVNRKCICLGNFISEKDAASDYNKAAIIHHKEFAVLNIDEKGEIL